MPPTGIIRYSMPAGHWVAGSVEDIVDCTSLEPSKTMNIPKLITISVTSLSTTLAAVGGSRLKKKPTAICRCFCTPTAIEINAIQIIKNKATSSDQRILVPRNLRLITWADTTTTMTTSTIWEYVNRREYSKSKTYVIPDNTGFSFLFSSKASPPLNLLINADMKKRATTSFFAENLWQHPPNSYYRNIGLFFYS